MPDVGGRAQRVAHDRAQPLVDRLDGADLHDALDELLNATRHGGHRSPAGSRDAGSRRGPARRRRVREVRVAEQAREPGLRLGLDNRIDRERGLRAARVLALDLDVRHAPHLEVAQLAVGQHRAGRQQQAPAAFEQVGGERHARLEVLEVDSHRLRGTRAHVGTWNVPVIGWEVANLRVLTGSGPLPPTGPIPHACWTRGSLRAGLENLPQAATPNYLRAIRWRVQSRRGLKR